MLVIQVTEESIKEAMEKAAAFVGLAPCADPVLVNVFRPLLLHQPPGSRPSKGGEGLVV